MADRYACVACRKEVTKTKNDRYRTHTDGDGEPCEMSSVEIPEHILALPSRKGDDPSVPREGVDYARCGECGRKVKLTSLGYFEPHDRTLRGGDRCPKSGTRLVHSKKVQTEIVHLPPDDEVGDLKHLPSPESVTTSTPSRTPVSEHASTSSDAPGEPAEPASAGSGQPGLDQASSALLQPGSPFSQPAEKGKTVSSQEAMSERGREIATRLREIFYAYTNRNSRDNRSAQTTLGPSEVGSPCDRQIAMKLLGVEPTNPQEGWAPFVGTAVHRDLAEMFQWANGARSGRYVVEMPLEFGSLTVPRGTGDLLDRVMMMFLDHKLMGSYSLNKLIKDGPSETYRKQIQVYALGAERAGERVKEVAIIGWPRQESSLDKLYVHVEPYDRRIAEEALARAERIARNARDMQYAEVGDPMEVARNFRTGDDCKWCPFHLKGDKEMRRGCPGK